MPSHSVKQAKVMSAIAHGWHPDQGSVAKIPLKVAKDFHAADAGHKYGKGMGRKKARGGEVDPPFDPQLPASLRPVVTYNDRPAEDVPWAEDNFMSRWGSRAIPAMFQMYPPELREGLEHKARELQGYADGGDVDWSRYNQPYGELKGTAPEDTPVRFKHPSNAMLDIHEGDIDRGINVGMGAGPGVMVGPYGAFMLRQAGYAKPHPVYAEEVRQTAEGLHPAFREPYTRNQVDLRDAEARHALETRPQGASDSDVWARAGWYRGSDQVPRKEIPDIGAKLVPLFEGSNKVALEHPAGDFHKIYDIPPIQFDPKMKVGNGSFEPRTKQIVLGGHPTPENLKSGVSAALHEMQHVIQNAEGMNAGSNPFKAMARPELAHEYFPEKYLAEGDIRPAGFADTIMGPIPDQPYLGERGHIPSWQQGYAERQAKRGTAPETMNAAYRRGVFNTYENNSGEAEARNVQRRRAASYNYATHPEDTEGMTLGQSRGAPRGLQWDDRSTAPRPRAEVLETVKNHMIREAEGRNWKGELRRKLFGPSDKPPGYASGGGISNFNPEKSAAYGLARQGMLHSNVPGRTDKLNLDVPTGSYIIPADIPSALGQGNSMAGAGILNKMFAKGPYGMNIGKARGGMRTHNRRSSLSAIRFAEGGETDVAPIVAAGGEYVVHPDSVAELGHGDIGLGHDILDSFVKQVRADNIKTLRGLKPPKGSK